MMNDKNVRYCKEGLNYEWNRSVQAQPRCPPYKGVQEPIRGFLGVRERRGRLRARGTVPLVTTLHLDSDATDTCLSL
jgi:hypothetical protein